MMMMLLIAPTAMARSSLRILRIASRAQEDKRITLKRAKVKSPTEAARVTTRMVLTFDVSRYYNI